MSPLRALNSSRQTDPRRRRTLAAAIGCALLLAACGGSSNTATNSTTGANSSGAAPSANSGNVTVVAADYAFQMPSTLPAGHTSFTLVNNGEQPHMFVLVKLHPDAPDIAKLVHMSQKDAGKYVDQVGEIKPVKPGDTSAQPLTADLEAGTYGYACFVPSPKNSEGHGKPHAFLGMYGTFDVS